MNPDPPVRKDGFCACGCGRERKPGRSRRYGGAAAELDPWATTDCARAYHGQPPTRLSSEEMRRLQIEAHRGECHNGANNMKHGTRAGYRLCACDECRAAVGKGAA